MLTDGTMRVGAWAGRCQLLLGRLRVCNQAVDLLERQLHQPAIAGCFGHFVFAHRLKLRHLLSGHLHRRVPIVSVQAPTCTCQEGSDDMVVALCVLRADGNCLQPGGQRTFVVTSLQEGGGGVCCADCSVFVRQQGAPRSAE